MEVYLPYVAGLSLDSSSGQCNLLREPPNVNVKALETAMHLNVKLKTYFMRVSKKSDSKQRVSSRLEHFVML